MKVIVSPYIKDFVEVETIEPVIFIPCTLVFVQRVVQVPVFQPLAIGDILFVSESMYNEMLKEIEDGVLRKVGHFHPYPENGGELGQ